MSVDERATYTVKFETGGGVEMLGSFLKRALKDGSCKISSYTKRKTE